MTALGESGRAWAPRRLRAWLLTDSPGSALQARCGRWYLTWGALRRNPLGGEIAHHALDLALLLGEPLTAEHLVLDRRQEEGASLVQLLLSWFRLGGLHLTHR